MNEKNDDFLMKICGFWIDFEADFKPSILKQDKADQCRKAHTKGDDRLYRKGRYHQATDFGGGAGRTYGGAGSDCGERDLQPLQFLCAKQNGHLHFASAVQLRLDTIAVFDHARLVESGTHTALWLPTANMQRCAVERAGKVLCVACSSTTMPLPAKTKK